MSDTETYVMSIVTVQIEKFFSANCFQLIIKQLFLFESATVRLNFDIFSSIFGNLAEELNINKLQIFRSKSEPQHLSKRLWKTIKHDNPCNYRAFAW